MERTRRHDRRRVSISAEDGGVQRLNVAEGIFVANGSIVCLSIDDGCQQRQQERKEGGHCELLLNGSSKWLVSVHLRREPTFLYARALRSDTFEHHGRSNAGSRQWILPTLSILYYIMPVPRLAHFVRE
jgi:hypothetical protein